MVDIEAEKIEIENYNKIVKGYGSPDGCGRRAGVTDGGLYLYCERLPEYPGTRRVASILRGNIQDLGYFHLRHHHDPWV